MVAKPATVTHATEPSERLLTGVCVACGHEDPFNRGSTPCERCGGKVEARDDTPEPRTLPTWDQVLAVVSAEDEADERKDWGEDLYWSQRG